MSTPLCDMFMFTVESDTLTLEEKRFLVDWTIRPALRTVPGVADVNALERVRENLRSHSTSGCHGSAVGA